MKTRSLAASMQEAHVCIRPARPRPGHPVAAAGALLAAVALFTVASCSASSSSGAAAASLEPSAGSPPQSTSQAAPATRPGAARHSTGAAGGAHGTFTAFAGDWIGHTRSLTISSSGHGEEHVNDGCCTTVLDMTFELSAPRGSGPAHATATATVLTLDLHGNNAPNSPRVGQRGTFSISDGVLTDQLNQVTFCNNTQQVAGTCGA
jgi:hypothetical protein